MLLSLLLLPLATATIYVTNPVASTTGVGGQVLNVEWTDDGAAPRLADIGVCKVDLCVGSKTRQVILQNLAQSVDVSAATSISTTIKETAGETGNHYFVKFSCPGATDVDGQPFTQFSARFSLESMTGSFSDDEKDLIDGETGAEVTVGAATPTTLTRPAGAVQSETTSASASALSTAKPTTSANATSSANGTASASPTPSTAPENGAMGVLAPVGLAIAAGIAGYIAM